MSMHDTADAINSLHQDRDPRIRIFFKYQTMRPYTCDTLTARDIYFSKWEELNDVFDPYLPMIARAHPGIPLGDDEESTQSYETFAASRLFCLSEECDNQLLWSHYSDVYRGFCLGYASYQANDFSFLASVQYLNRLPDEIMTQQSFTEDEIVRLFLRIKPMCWSYEKEWRLIDTGIEGRYPSPLPVVSLIFGYQMPMEQRAQLVEATRATNPRLFVATPRVDKGYFRVSIDKCILGENRGRC